MNIVIPAKLHNLLNGPERAVISARLAVSAYSEWLPQSKLPFFPEYTDHGSTHISSVLATAEQLISDDVFSLLTSMDAAAFLVAVLLHDIAMHLTEDGFTRLVLGKTALTPITELGDRPWPMLWEEFVRETYQFSAATNMQMYGDPEPVEAPSVRKGNWTKKQYMLIGEFLRRHHFRLSHQIALRGFPGEDSERFALHGLMDSNVLDIVGLIARSHGMPLRFCIDYLEKNHYNRVDPLGIHAVFLMCLLRIADYLQLESDRSTMRFRLQSFRSPRSTLEHMKHLAVTQLTRHTADAQALTVIVRPDNVKSAALYFALQTLFESVQRELDECSAVLGEVYSRHIDDHLNVLGLNVRRIRSNISEPHFISRLMFAPTRARFKTAQLELFTLLIKPLYGTDPDIGVRELVQNSLDAVRELERYCEKHGIDQQTLDRGSQTEDVEVRIDHAENGSYLVVSDRGIGMSLEVIRDYFLAVGASFRESQQWKLEFARDDQASTVLRTGYFGIGVLASFLIGTAIHVSTRHIDSTEGIEFKAALDTDPIELNRVSRPIGTCIRVPLSNYEIDHPWTPHVPYFLRKPSLRVCGSVPPVFYPDLNESIPDTWQRVPKESHPFVLWNRIPDREVNRVTHNGFLLESAKTSVSHLWQDDAHGTRVLCPPLHIFDPEGNKKGKTYIDLARTRLLKEDFEPMGDILDDVMRDFLGFLIATASRLGQALSDPLFRFTPYVGGNTASLSRAYPLITCKLTRLKEGLSGKGIYARPWVFTTTGISPFDAGMLDEMGVTTVLLASSFAFELLPRDATEVLLLVGQDLSELEHLANELDAPKALNVFQAEACQLDGEFQSVTRSHKKSQQATPRLNDLVETARQTLSLPRTLMLGTWVRHLSIKPRKGVSPVVKAWKNYIGQSALAYKGQEKGSHVSKELKSLDSYIQVWKRLLEKGFRTRSEW